MSKTILVTGGARGLARSLAESLAGEGHRLVITARDAAAGTRAVEEIRKTHPSAVIEMHQLELASFADIRRFARSLLPDLKLDVLVHVAGIMQQSRTRRVTVDGLEETLAVNALAPFLLTHELWPRLRNGASVPRIVCVSSSLHMPGSRGPSVDFDFDDPNLEKEYDPDRAYKNSKLAVLWFAYELARRFPPPVCTTHGVCPGFVPTTAAASTTGMQRIMLKYVLPLMPFATSVAEAVSLLRLLTTDPALDASTGDYWEKGKRSASSDQSRDENDAKKFWSFAERATGVERWTAS